MNPNNWLAVLTGALMLVTAYYAWTAHRLLGTIEDMVAATREVAATTFKTYALSVAPQVVCRTVTHASTGRDPAGAPAGQWIADTTITNVGPHRVRLTRVRLEGDPGGEQVRRFVDRWLVTRDVETVGIAVERSAHIKVFVHFEDMAGESHVVVSEQVPGDAAAQAGGPGTGGISGTN
jgi:hypothetical protein